MSILNGVAATQGANDEMSMLGQRVRGLRKQHRLSQERLASMAGTSPSQISLVESGKSKPSLKTAVAIARALDTSLDFLTGAAEDSRKVTQLHWELGRQSGLLIDLQAEIQKRTGNPWTDFVKQPWTDFVGIAQIDAAAGAGTVADAREERVIGRIKFPSLWLRREGLHPRRCRIMEVIGESMEPTLPDRCVILVDRSRQKLEDGKVFLIHTRDEWLVRRALGHKTEGWLLSSDNRDKKTWPTMPWPEDGGIGGEVRWAWFSLP